MAQAGKGVRAEQGQGRDQRTETRQGRIRTGAEERDSSGAGQEQGWGGAVQCMRQGRAGSGARQGQRQGQG